MRRKQLTRIVAGSVAGCPGLDDRAPSRAWPDEPPGAMPPEPPPSTLSARGDLPLAAGSPRRSAWITVSGLLLIVQGGLGIVYAPLMTPGGGGLITPVVLVIWAYAAANIASGIGLVRCWEWARIAAGAIAAGSLALIDVPALFAASSDSATRGFDALGLVTHLVVLFAVARRWPRGSSRQASR